MTTPCASTVALAQIVSPFAPPSTIASPLPVLIVSTPPIVSETVKIRPSVSFSEPNWWSLLPGEWISPESPMITLVPMPAVTRSSSAPAITRFAPSPRVIWSLPPMPGLVETASSMKLPSALQSM